jgi:hypothetical protein
MTLTLRFERDFPGIRNQSVDAYDLLRGKNLEKLEVIATELGVGRFSDFWRHSELERGDLTTEQQMALIIGNWDDDWGEEPKPPELWYDAVDGLATIRALRVYLQDHPRALQAGKAELKEFETALDEANRHRVKFNFYVDL